MDNTDSDAVVKELSRGGEVGRKLLAHIDSGCSSIETCRQLTMEVMSSFEKCILIVTSSSGAAALESKQRVASCPNSGGTEPTLKKRKTMRKWSSQVRLGSVEDGYNWRKYGQKDILGARNPREKFLTSSLSTAIKELLDLAYTSPPRSNGSSLLRSYYRCTHRHTQGCPAIKQVQISDENPVLFDVTYRGTHTCNLKVNKAVPLQKQDMLLSLQTGLKVKTEGLDFHSQESSPSFPFPSTTVDFLVKAEKVNFSPSSTLDNSFAAGSLFVSPTTSESNYFPGHSFRAVAESHEFTDSAETSASNFPLLDMDFMLDLDKDFLFDSSFLSENF